MTPKTYSPEDLTLYAMQLLSPEESADILVHLEHNEAARKEIAQVQGELALLALTSEMHSPPALARERLLRRVAKEKKLVPVTQEMPAVQPASAASAPGFVTSAVAEVHGGEPVLFSRGRGRLLQMEDEPVARRGNAWFSWSGWAMAAGLAVYAGMAYQHDRAGRDAAVADNDRIVRLSARAERADAVMAALTNPAALEVALHEPSAAPVAPKPEAHAAYVAETGSLVFVASHLAPLQAYKTYELWVIPSDGRDPVPAGTFKPDERGYASVILPEISKGIPAKTFGVTIEDDGGSKTPTPPIVLAGM